jgi:hypothetical protein
VPPFFRRDVSERCPPRWLSTRETRFGFSGAGDGALRFAPLLGEFAAFLSTDADVLGLGSLALAGIVSVIWHVAGFYPLPSPDSRVGSRVQDLIFDES